MQLTDVKISQEETLDPPRTKGFPLVGSIPMLLHKQLDYLFDAWRTHGDIYELDLGAMSIVALNHPDYAMHVLRDNARNYDKSGAIWESLRDVIGNGLVTSEGQYWRRQRRMIQPHFHRQHLAGLVELMQEAIEQSMREFDKFALSGEAFDITKAFANVTMQVIVRSMFGRNLKPEDADLMGEAMRYTLDYQIQNMITGKLPQWMPVPGRKTYREMLAQADNFLNDMIEDRRMNGDAGDDLLSMFLNLADDETGEPLTNKEIRDEVATIFLAGYETTAIVMTWATHLLIQHPDVTNRLRSEIDEVLEGRTPKFEDLRRLTYPVMVMEETMRLYPPTYWLPRTAVNDDMIGGYHIKAGQLVAPMMLTIHRHPDFWDEPDTFNPENFSVDKKHKRHTLAWMPFGAGQRLCIGKDFALMEGALILARLMQHYTLHAVEGREPQPAIATTLSSKDGVWVSLKPRSGK